MCPPAVRPMARPGFGQAWRHTLALTANRREWAPVWPAPRVRCPRLAPCAGAATFECAQGHGAWRAWGGMVPTTRERKSFGGRIGLRVGTSALGYRQVPMNMRRGACRPLITSRRNRSGWAHLAWRRRVSAPDQTANAWQAEGPLGRGALPLPPAGVGVQRRLASPSARTSALEYVQIRTAGQHGASRSVSLFNAATIPDNGPRQGAL
jgi:hypothetical protein